MQGGSSEDKGLEAMAISTRGHVSFPLLFNDMRQFLIEGELACKNPWVRMKIQDISAWRTSTNIRRGGQASQRIKEEWKKKRRRIVTPSSE